MIMAATTDIGKLYSLMDENPNKYKEIAANEHQLKIARANWPLMQTMASRPVDIPDVLLCEKLVERVEIKLTNRQAKTEHTGPHPAIVIALKACEMALYDAGDSSTGMASSFTDDPLKVVEMKTAKALESGNSHVVDRPANQVPTLAHLFNKARESALLETGVSGVGTASSLTDDALKVVVMANANVREPVKNHIVERPASKAPTLANLFSRLEADPRSKSLSAVFLKVC